MSSVQQVTGSGQKLFRFALLSMLFIGAGTSCEDPGKPAQDARTNLAKILRIIDPPDVDVGIALGAERALRVRYTDTNLTPIPGALVNFAIFGDPRGSTLSSDASLTNTNGEAEVRLRSGAASCRFLIHVSAPEVNEDAIFYIEVSDAGFGEVAVYNHYDGSQPEAVLAWTQYNLYGDIQCSSIDPSAAPPPPLRERVVSGVDKAVHFGALPLNLDHSLVVNALDAEFQPLLTGCIDIPSSILKVDQLVNLTLWLHDRPLKSVGSYNVTTLLTLEDPAHIEAHPLNELFHPWFDLTDCKLDPAQLMVDCILDAVESGASADCVVDSLSSLVLSLQAQRGELKGSCRSEANLQGAPSLELELAEVMSKSGHATLLALSEVPTVAPTVLNNVRLGSTLRILGENSGGNATMTHRLDTIEFTSGTDSFSVDSNQAGLANPFAAPVLGKTSQSRLGITEHHFSFPLLPLARLAIGPLLLEPRSLPATSVQLAQSLVELVTFQLGNTTFHGCAAIEHLMCEAAQLPEDCLGEACPQGVAALAHYLDFHFDVHEQASSIIVSGTVPLVDTNHDLKTDQLGDPLLPGLWKSKIKAGLLVVSPYSATFTGIRQ